MSFTWATTFVLVATLGAGCSSSPTTHETKVPEAGPSSRPSLPTDAPSASTADTGPETRPPRAVPAEQAVLQLAIDVPELQQYFHVDTLPERKPLKILASDEALPSPPAIEKFGEPVSYIDKPIDDAYLRVRKLHIEGLTAEVSLEYPIEGVVCKVWLTQKDGVFHVSQADCLEQ